MHQTCPTSRDPHGERCARTGARRLRAIFGVAALASILTATTGCDKNAETAEVPVRRTSLASKPNIVFLLFGDRSDPRVLPLATIIEGQVAPLSLDAHGWRDFDRIYFRPGTPLSLYRDGRTDGEGEIRRGMWDASGPLYTLPRSRALKPLAALLPRKSESSEVMLERIATSDRLAPAPERGPVPHSAIDSARAVALRVSQREGITRNARAGLDLATLAIHTGATNWPTLVVSYMERGGGIQGHPRHLFVLADSAAGGYAATFVHSADDSLPEFRRFIDHADITGDGIDELLLEGWANGGDSFLLFLRYTNGKWREMARDETSWCADVKPKR
jgi:hypothetical protein